MRKENESASIWYAVDAPPPTGSIPSGAPVIIIIGVYASPGNRVEVHFRVNQGVEEVVTAKWFRNDSSARAQYFRAGLPSLAFRPGDKVEYTAICGCAGQEAKLPWASFSIGVPAAASTQGPRSDEKKEADSPFSSGHGAPVPPPWPAAPVPSAQSARIRASTRNSSRATTSAVPTTAAAPKSETYLAPPGRDKSATHPGSVVTVPPKLQTAQPVNLQVANVPGPTVADLAALLGMGSSRFISEVASHGISTLQDVRRAGGLTRLASPGDLATAQLIDAHADLARVSADFTANAKLISTGFKSTLGIANTSLSAFLSATAAQVGVVTATRIHVAANAVSRVVEQLVTTSRLDATNGVRSELPPESEAIINPEEELPCQCCACHAAESPAAYLADLLSYAVKHLRHRRLPITLQFLTDTFYQPFGDLPTDCGAVDQQVREVRLCVEVLRNYLKVHAPTANQKTALEAAQKAYLLAAYSALLDGIGTSFEEIRLARHADTATRNSLAERLGLTIDSFGSGRPDALDKLLLDPTVSAPGPVALSESNLERLFGLVDTTRNPLSDGPILNDAAQQITRWNLAGVTWGRNTDPDGNIFVSLSHASPSLFKVALYKDAGLTQLVALGEQTISGGVITGKIGVAEENASGLTGSFQIASPIDNPATTSGPVPLLTLGPIPLLTAWQLQTLRSEWLAQDEPSDGYTDGISVAVLPTLPPGVFFSSPLNLVISYDASAHVLIFSGVMTPSDLAQLLALSVDAAYASAVKTLYVQSQRLPVIDPDVLGPDDFRVPSPKAHSSDPDNPFDIWLRRRSWVDTLLQSLVSKTKVVNGQIVPDIAGMLATMYVPLTYVSTTTAPWNAGTPTTTFETMWENIAEGVSVDEIRLQLAADLALPIDAFNRLMDIWHQDQGAALDPRNPLVTADEWREVYSLLAEAAKTRFFSSWRSEESALGVVFGSRDFVVSLGEPQVGDWPPVVPAGQPFIDPALVALTDLPEGTTGERALTFWQARAAEVGLLTDNIRATREASGLQAALMLAIGDPNPGDSLPADLDALAQQLLDPNPSVVATATTTVETALFMSVDAFNRLMVIRAKDADPNPLGKPTPPEWIELYGILTAAETKKRSYPTWLAKEAAPATGVVYWTARKARLPLWRAPTDLRAEWHVALAVRSGQPIIDPDLITSADFINPVPGNPAFALWQQRNTWVQSQLGLPAPANLAALDAALLAALGIQGTDLVAIAEQRDGGSDIRPRLNQLSLTNEAFDDLVGIRGLVDGGVPVLQFESDGLWSILAQVTKQRQFAMWLQEEQAHLIVLGPDLFQPFSTVSAATAGCGCPAQGLNIPTPPALPVWRATQTSRQDWEDILSGREEQQAATISAANNVVDAAEGATLTQLRDALLLATDAPGAGLAAKADWFTSKLMIDAETSGCQKTTRIEQALETLQTVMTGVRNGQIGSYDLELTSAPVAISPTGAGRIDVFARGPDYALWHKWWDNTGGSEGTWHDWDSLDGYLTSAPTVTSMAYGTMDVFASGKDYALWHRAYSGGNWSAWESLGGGLDSGPAACSQEQGSIDVFARGGDVMLWQISGQTDQSGTSWSAWQQVARTPPLPSGTIWPFYAPAVVASGTGVYDVFALVGFDRSLWHVQFAGAWSGWDSIGGSLTSNPAALSLAPNTLDVFALGDDYAVWRRSWRQGSGWSSWTSIGGSATEGPGVSTWGSGRFDVFVGGPDHRLWHKWWDGAWHGWEGTDELTMDAPCFDEEWKWMGSYATWRAAILVFMYPENVLDPTLRKVEYQTPGFKNLVAQIQSNPSLTPDQAYQQAQTYLDQFADICSLQIAASCEAGTQVMIYTDPCGQTPIETQHNLIYMFAVGGNSGQIYWSGYDESNPFTGQGYRQSFWDYVPGLTGEKVTKVIGAVPFTTSLGSRYVFLFAVARDGAGTKLVFTRYNLDTRVWDVGNTELELPPGAPPFEATLLPTPNGGSSPPSLRIQLSKSAIFDRALNDQGTTWADTGWSPLVPPWGDWAAIDSGSFTFNYGAIAVSRKPNRIDFFGVDDQPNQRTVVTTGCDVSTGPAALPAWTAIPGVQLFRRSNAQPNDVHFPLYANVTAVARDENHIDLFVISEDTMVYTTSWGDDPSGQWKNWTPISPPNLISTLCTAVAAVSTGPNHMDVFIIDANGYVQTNSWDVDPNKGQWPGWTKVNQQNPANVSNSGGFGLEVAAVARPGNRIDLFLVDRDGYVLTLARDSSMNWPAAWQSISPDHTANLPNSIVTAISHNPAYIDVFTIDDKGSVLTVQWDSSDNNGPWGKWQPVGSPNVADGDWGLKITAVARTPDHLDLFVTGPARFAYSGAFELILTAWWDAHLNQGAWSDWASINTVDAEFSTRVAAVACNSNRLDICAVTSQGTTMAASWDGVAPIAAQNPVLPPDPWKPNVSAPFNVPVPSSSDNLQSRRALIKQAFDNNAGGPEYDLEYLREAYYFVPMYLAEQLQKQGQYSSAFDWFRTVYDYSVSVELRNIYYGFELEKTLSAVSQRAANWLLDPLDPHLIAATRRFAYARYTILSIAQCFLDYADARFTYDTAESDAEARTLYMTALELLALPIFFQAIDPCEGLQITVQNGQEEYPVWEGTLQSLNREIRSIDRVSVLKQLVPQIQSVLEGDTPWPNRFAAARSLIAQEKRQLPPSPSMTGVLAYEDAFVTRAYSTLLSIPALDTAAMTAATAAGNAFDAHATSLMAGPSVAGQKSPARTEPPSLGRTPTGLPEEFTPSTPNGSGQGPFLTPGGGGSSYEGVVRVPRVSFWFCTPPDPLINTLRMHAELNLYKLRNCMNIAGIVRQVDPYSAPTDVCSGLPSIGGAGQLLLPGAVVIQPTPYSYSVLIERAKQLVQIAGQMEATMLSLLEKADAASFEELQARQNLQVANATVQLQRLSVQQATDGVSLALLQQKRAQTETSHWQQMLQSDVASLEQQAIDAQKVEAGLQVASSVLSSTAALQSGFSISSIFTSGSGGTTEAATALSTLGASFGTYAAINQAQASMEVQQSDWQYQYDLGVDDANIAAQQIVNARDQVQIAAQQLTIAQLQATQKSDILEFLTHKFTNAALYTWMSGVLQDVYSYFLRQATAVARMAENQMAFQRQEVPPGFVKADYWQPVSPSTAAPTDTKGLTGSARLTQDIYELDQYYFTTDQRKLQLTKTISLAQLSPIELQRLRDTGVMNFTTPMTLFDLDFPGHYLRLISKVSTTVIALIPPGQGIKATLSTTAATRVVTGSEVFQKTIVRRDPQSVALSSPTNATGVFALDPQSNLLAPFEGLGVEAQWQFSMPKSANPFDYSSLADVLISIDYTALDSSLYRVNVLRQLDNKVSAERPFSFRNDLADQWWALHNPDQSATPMAVEFNIANTDFPPNIEDIRIQQIILYFSRPQGASFEVLVNALRFAEGISPSSVGGAATTIDGVISTRRGNAASWMPMIGKTPFGKWQVVLPNTQVVRDWIANNVIDDMLFVITYSAKTPPYPSG